MNGAFFSGLIYNAALLLAMVLVFELMFSSLKTNKPFIWQVVIGIILGGIGLAVMETNWELLQGIIFDTRSVLLGVTGLFFGWIPTIIVMIMTVVYRVYLGGNGIIMGIAVIISSGVIGLIWRYFRQQKLSKLSWVEFYIFGLFIHIVMLGLTILLPSDIRGEVLSKIWLPVITIFPVATLLLGITMSNAVRKNQVADELKATLESTADGILAVDNKGKILLVNRRFAELWRIPDSLIDRGNDQELLDYVVNQLVSPEAFLKKVKALYASDEVDIDVITFVDGRVFERYSFPMVTNGARVGRVWSFRDITKEREVDRLKTDFISLASHQLRTPLTGIKWFVELLQENPEKLTKDKIKECVRKIGVSSDRMIALVNDLLMTSRADSGKLKMETESFPVKKLLQRSIDEQGRLFAEKNIKIVGVDDIPSGLKVEVDIPQMTQVFGNIFNNAASYSPTGSVITVKVLSLRGKVRVSIADQGVGIPKGEQGKVFSKFFRADNVAKTIPGTGLGLYVSKSIVDSHGGKIWFESKENSGTAFFVELLIKQKNG